MKLLQELHKLIPHNNLHEARGTVYLTDKDKENILDDIEVWSGGHSPADLDDEQINNYIEHSLSAEYDPGLVRAWLKDFIAGGSDVYVVTDIHHNPDDISVLVVAGDEHLQPASHEYYGVNVVFIRGGHVELVTNDKMAEWQAKNHRELIIDTAKKAIRQDMDSVEYFNELGFR